MCSIVIVQANAVEVALDPSELDLDTATIAARLVWFMYSKLWYI